MYSFLLTTKKCQQAGAASHAGATSRAGATSQGQVASWAGATSQATSHVPRGTWSNQQSGNGSNSYWHSTVSSNFQRLMTSDVSLHNDGYWRQTCAPPPPYPATACPPYPATACPPYPAAKYCNGQAPLTNGQKVLPDSLTENTDFTTSQGFQAFQSYGNMNQNFRDPSLAQRNTTNATSVSGNQTTHDYTLTPATASNVQRFPNKIKQNTASNRFNPNAFWSNLATSENSAYNDNAVYLSNGPRLSSSGAQLPQHYTELHSANHYKGAGNDAANSAQSVLKRKSNFNESISSSSVKDFKMFSRNNESAVAAAYHGPPSVYYSSKGDIVQKFVRQSQSFVRSKESVSNACVSQINSRHFLQKKYKSGISKVASPDPPVDSPGKKAVAVVLPRPCEYFQVFSEPMPPDREDKCIVVKKKAALLQEEVETLEEKSPQSSAQEPRLDNEKEDAQTSVPSSTLETTKSPKDQGDKDASWPIPPNCFVLRDGETFKEQPYKSSWLNVNEQLDDIDKEFGFPWSLMYKYYQQESSDDREDMTTGGSSSHGSEASNQVVSQTQLSPAQTPEGEASSPESDNEVSNESCYSFKLEVLPQEVARQIFEQTKSWYPLNTEKDKDPHSSKLKDDTPHAKTTEKTSGLQASELELNRFQAAMDSDGTSKMEKKSAHHVESIDLTDSNHSTIITLSDEDIIVVENAAPTKMTDLDHDTPAPEETYAASVEVATSESLENPTNHENDNKVDCEQSQEISAEVSQPYLDTQTPLSSLSNLDNQSSAIQKSKKCLQSNADSQHAPGGRSKPEDTLVDAAVAWHSSSVRRTAQLVLYGSSHGENHVNKAPTSLSVSLSPLKRKTSSDAWRKNIPIKQLILQKWRESFKPIKIPRRHRSPSVMAPPKKTGVGPRDSPLKKGKVEKHNHKKYAVMVKKKNVGEKSKLKSKECPSAIKENNVLKFTVLPNTFTFKTQPETIEKTPAADSAGRDHSGAAPEAIGGKHRSSIEAVNKSNVSWNVNHSKLHLGPLVPKKVDHFQESQKKDTKDVGLRATFMVPRCLF